MRRGRGTGQVETHDTARVKAGRRTLVSVSAGNAACVANDARDVACDEPKIDHRTGVLSFTDISESYGNWSRLIVPGACSAVDR